MSTVDAIQKNNPVQTSTGVWGTNIPAYLPLALSLPYTGLILAPLTCAIDKTIANETLQKKVDLYTTKMVALYNLKFAAASLAGLTVSCLADATQDEAILKKGEEILARSKDEFLKDTEKLQQELNTLEEEIKTLEIDQGKKETIFLTANAVSALFTTIFSIGLSAMKELSPVVTISVAICAGTTAYLTHSAIHSYQSVQKKIQ